MTAGKKRAKKKTSKAKKAAKPKVFTMTIYADKSFTPIRWSSTRANFLKL
ncbi:MAG TPA: hypothetical protein VMP68_22710 [Candidatus Eisenbacteria bacterium]|nr:hypothetical protein [Candidatus Eisenbacteria bacterium]